MPFDGAACSPVVAGILTVKAEDHASGGETPGTAHGAGRILPFESVRQDTAMYSRFDVGTVLIVVFRPALRKDPYRSGVFVLLETGRAKGRAAIPESNKVSVFDDRIVIETAAEAQGQSQIHFGAKAK